MMTKAYVTDTHPLVFHAQGGSQLSPKAKKIFTAAEREEAIIYVPVIVLWELSLLLRVNKVRLALRSVSAFSEALFSNPAYQVIDLSLSQVEAGEHKRPNEDPFDALICAAACSLGLPLITRDALISEADWIESVW
jgi:PIN domain nuclease of toxin-antitoxin system